MSRFGFLPPYFSPNDYSATPKHQCLGIRTSVCEPASFMNTRQVAALDAALLKSELCWNSRHSPGARCASGLKADSQDLF